MYILVHSLIESLILILVRGKENRSGSTIYPRLITWLRVIDPKRFFLLLLLLLHLTHGNRERVFGRVSDSTRGVIAGECLHITEHNR